MEKRKEEINSLGSFKRWFWFVMVLCFSNSGMAQNLKNQYTLISEIKQESNGETCVIDGTIDPACFLDSQKFITLFLYSKKDFYTSKTDSNFKFQFTKVVPGKYFLKPGVLSNSSKTGTMATFIQSVNLKKGNYYALQIINGKHSKDTCCYIGSSIKYTLKTSEINGSLKHSKMIHQIFTLLVTNPNVIIELGVHLSQRDSLSKECTSCIWAQKIKQKLVEMGIQEERMLDHGFEASRPYFIDPKNPKQLSKNQRVEITILPTN